MKFRGRFSRHLLGIVIAFLLAVLLSFQIGARVGRIRRESRNVQQLPNKESIRLPQTPEDRNRLDVKEESPKEEIKPAAPTTTVQRESSQKQEPAVRYTVQLGAFNSQERARRFADELLREGYDARVVYRTGFHRVFVGTFSAKSDAKRYGEKIKSELKLDAYLINKP